MKKLFLAIAMVLVATAASFGQEFKEMDFLSRTNRTTTDTVTTTGTPVTKILAIPSTPQYWRDAGVGITVGKISGTVGGVVRLMASYDGVNYFRILPTDSLNLANIPTNYKSFTLTSYPYKYLGVSITGSGTMSATGKAKVLLKRGKQ